MQGIVVSCETFYVLQQNCSGRLQEFATELRIRLQMLFEQRQYDRALHASAKVARFSGGAFLMKIVPKLIGTIDLCVSCSVLSQCP